MIRQDQPGVPAAERDAGPQERGPFTSEGIPRALWWDADAQALALIDQTLLPSRLEVLICHTAEQVAEAIRALRVRGAPAIGIAAAYGLALGPRETLPAGEDLAAETALARLRTVAEQLRATRPTAVNLAWALE